MGGGRGSDQIDLFLVFTHECRLSGCHFPRYYLFLMSYILCPLSLNILEAQIPHTRVVDDFPLILQQSILRSQLDQAARVDKAMDRQDARVGQHYFSLFLGDIS